MVPLKLFPCMTTTIFSRILFYFIFWYKNSSMALFDQVDFEKSNICIETCQKVRCAANKIRVKKFLHSFIIGERESVESICRNVSSAANKIRMKKFLYFFIIGERESES